jgi:raffinose/stachyose/melibiose transport system substrate-binding protein
MRQKKTVVVIALCGLLTSLAACSGGGSSSGTAAAAGTGDGVLTFMSWDSTQTMQPLVNEFEKENPGIHIQMSYAPPVQQYTDTLQQRLLAHTAADVFILGNKSEQAGSGYVMNLSDVPAVQPALREMSSFNRDAETYDGKVYGVSVASWGGGMLVNLGLLAKVGVTKPPATWNDFIALCAKLKAAGIDPYLEPSDGISTTIMAKIGYADQESGGNMDTRIEQGQTTFSAAWTKPLQQWDQLFDNGLITSAVAGLTGAEVQSEFIAGKVAMIATGAWAVAPVRQGAPKMSIDFWPVPGAAAGEDYWAGAANPAYAINARAKNPVAAEKWIDFLASAEGTKLYHQITGDITTTSDYTPNLDPALSAMYPAVVDGKIWCTWQAWPGPGSDQLDAVFLADVKEAELGKATPASITQALDSEWSSLK